MRVRGLFVALILSCALASRAQGPDLAEARAQFAIGVAEARGGHWDRALVAFEAAYAIAPRPAVLFNLAAAQSRAGKLLAASANYRRIADSKDPSFTAAHKRAAERQIKHVEDRIPRLRVVIDGLRPDDRVLLDKSRLYPNELDLELWVDPGVHTLGVYRTGGQQEIRRLVMTEGEHRLMQFRVY